MRVDKASLSSDNNVKKPTYVTHDINVSHERSKNKNYMDCKGVKPLQETSGSIEMCKSAAITSDKKLSSQKCSSSNKGSTIDPKCTSAKEGEESATLESLANAISKLEEEMLACKTILRKIDRNLESFFETETTNKCTNKNISTGAVYVLDEFPLTNLSDLEKIEHKLKKDKTFHSKVVNALHSGVMGQSLQKKVNSILRMVLDDKLASSFNWKGQRGTKLKLAKRRITKIMI
ncbi:uncharacterized protein LOC112454165, partial [Temnothorax curvispinosus]|uniref:Uncharacterized protein LOC112454165 n=1 Tax=Temnothorax curvispinosus TaxID=300111 RepID=A0A6J1PQ20_9HYME